VDKSKINSKIESTETDSLTEHQKALLEHLLECFGLTITLNGIDPCTRTLIALAERYPENPRYQPYKRASP